MTQEEIKLWRDVMERVITEFNPDDEYPKGTKYFVKVGEKEIPPKVLYGRTYRIIEKEYPSATLYDRSGGVKTNQFIETCGFQIGEKLNYSVVEANTFEHHYNKKVKNARDFQNFIDFGFEMLQKLNIDMYKVRMAIDSGGDISVIIGMRAAYTYNEKSGKSLIGFLVSKDFKEKNKTRLNFTSEYNYGGYPDQSFVKVEITSWADLDSDLLDHHISQIKLQYDYIKDSKQTQWNVKANTTNSVIKYLMFRNENVENWVTALHEEKYDLRYWALGFNSNYERLDRFKNENFWQAIDFDKNDTSPTARTTRAKFVQISKGDLVVIKGYGGSHDLIVHYLGKVNDINLEDETLMLEKLPGELYRGKAPRGKGAGNWHDTIIEITRKRDIELLFYNKVGTEMENVKDEFIKWLIDNPRSNYFNNDYDTLNKYLDTYNSYFDLDIFLCNQSNYMTVIGEIEKVAYLDSNSEFYKYSDRESTHRPRAILGKTNYYQFLKNKFQSDQVVIDKAAHALNNNTMDLNKILYGPPGTGKTYKLQREYFDKFTKKETSLNRSQFIENIVSELSWWQVVAIAVLDLKTPKVSEIYAHEIIQKKAQLSNSKTVRQTIWGQLQSHTVMECENVNVQRRMEPLLFYKRKNSTWTINHEFLEESFPEAFEILTSTKNFRPNPDKLIRNYEFVTFHQSFGYEDFIEGIKPVMEEGSPELTYEIQDGVFKKLCMRAQGDPDNQYAIFIDEINRGNVSSIFGELITLVENDKRIGEENEMTAILPYSKQSFGVPRNIHIIGTMNTADRSVEALDTALRRRFVFEEIMPNPSLLNQIVFDGFNMEEVLRTINERIEVLLDRDHTIGHSYFISLNSGDTIKLKSIFANNIIPLLQEYFYHDYEKIALILGEGFVTPNKLKINFATFKEIDTPESETKYQLRTQITDIEKAVRILLNQDEQDQ